MNRNTTLLLIVWNVALTALIGWGLMRAPASSTKTSTAPDDTTAVFSVSTASRDTGALKEARIAYFHMDSVQHNYELIKEKDVHYAAEARRLQSNLQGEQAKAQQRYQELMAKDHSYSTQAEVDKDEAELQGLAARLQDMQASSEQQMARMEADMLKEITGELKDFLEEYNKVAGFDYIFSVQNGGQIWVGNKELN
ncbi:MAG TPA: OmpH family outer membrane protein, partial [Flavobacteriales bacterium]|nr:OmpH family outer membrane protein [Flavobacteriales bacterium]